MKIVIDVRSMGSKPSGIGMYTFNFVKEIVKSRKFEVVLLSDVATSQEIKLICGLGVRIITYGTRVYQSVDVLRYFCFVEKQLIAIQPDVFWEPNSLIPNKLKGYKGKTIVTIHDLFPITTPDYFSFKYRLYFKYVLKKSIKQADLLLFISDETRKCVEKFFPESKGKEYDISYIIIDGAMCNNVNKSKEYFLYVGNMERRKGVDLLLKGYQEYCNRGGNRELYLIGKMREKGIERQLKKLERKNPKIHYLGYVSEEEKEKAYEGCGCFVFPSKAEGFGMPVIEAMRYYKPIIASDLTIFKEIVGNQTVNYFELNGEDQIKNLADAMMNYKNANIEGYEEVLKRYTADILGDKLIKKISSN